jgi:serine/threonine protein kinase
MDETVALNELEKRYQAARAGLPADDSVVPKTDLPSNSTQALPAGADAVPVLPGYEILGVLGQGGMGVVYKARNVRLDRLVALKIIRPERAMPEMLSRFQTEAQAVARLNHAHIVQIYEVSEYQPADSAPVPYLALEFAPNGTLENHLGRKPMDSREAARLVRLLARAMHHAHERGIIHRDLKPDNVLLTPPSDEPSLNTPLGCPKITDFGLARAGRIEGALPTTASPGPAHLTQLGAFMGTPPYMAPEQAEGQTVGPPADVHALGAILYRLLTGHLPFENESLLEMLRELCHEPPKPPRLWNKKVPPRLEAICLRCLAKGPTSRPTAKELAEELGRYVERRHRPLAWVTGVTSLAMMLFLAFGQPVTLVRDLVNWLEKPDPGGSPAAVDSPVTAEDWSKFPQLLHITFHDTATDVRLAKGGSIKPFVGGVAPEIFPALWGPSMRFGLELADGNADGKRKRLTFKENGTTNNAVVKLDGRETIFGERPFIDKRDGQPLGQWAGKWHDRNAKLDRQLRDGRRSIWVYEEEQVYITQTVGLVPGAQSGKIDTCLVHYRIENKGTVPHSVGLRFLLDTYIGGNDGVPFLIPGRAQLCDDRAEFRTSADVPDFIQARESNDLRNPGTIALIQFRIPGIDAPSRVTLGAWPNPSLGPDCLQEKTLWDVPVHSIKANTPADSAVTIYWDPKTIDAGKSREVAFAYGLGSVSASEGGQLGLSVAGSFAPRGEFTLSVEVRNPINDQTLTLTLPEGFDLLTGGFIQSVPPNSAVSAVTWKIRGGPRQGSFLLGVKSSTGVSQTQEVDIKVRGSFGN